MMQPWLRVRKVCACACIAFGGCVTVAVAIIATPAAPAVSAPDACVGDCDNTQSVTVDDLLTMVGRALGRVDAGTCDAGDTNHDTRITVDEILAAANSAVRGCGTPGVDVSGRWTGNESTTDGYEESITFNLSQTGFNVTGTFETDYESGAFVGSFTVDGALLNFTLTETTPDCPGNFTGTATLNGDAMTFNYFGADCEDNFGASGSAQRVHLCTAAVHTDCCGNNLKEAGEECDGTAMPTCEDLGYQGGHTTCTDCRLNTENCFLAGQCSIGGACDESCFEICPGGDFSLVCTNGVCLHGSCACTEDFEECCRLAGGL
jgi:hypothetical protein